MIISFLDQCDLGVSFGIDDDFFKLNQSYLKSLNNSDFKFNQIQLLFENFEGNVFQNTDLFSIRSFSFGYGIKINLKNDVVFAKWQKSAELYAKEEFENELKIINFISTLQFKDFYFIFYSVGFITVRLDVECDFDENINYTDLSKVINECNFDYDRYLKDKINLLLIHLEKKEFIDRSTLYKITKRDTAFKELYFSHLFICNANEANEAKLLEQMNVINNYKISEKLVWRDDILYWGYIDSLLISNENNESEQEAIIYLIQILSVYRQITLSFEKFIEKKLVMLTKKKLQNNVTISDITEINQQKTFLTTIINLSDYSSTSSIHITDMQFFENFENFYKLSVKQEKLLSTFEIFSNIQSDFANIEQTKRDNVLNRTLFFLTTLTIVSVLADLISTTDYSNNLIPDKYARLIILLFVPIILFITFNYIIKKKTR